MPPWLPKSCVWAASRQHGWDVCGATLVPSAGFPRLAGHLGPPAPASCTPEWLAPGMPPPGPVLMHAGGSTETATRRGAEARCSGGAAGEEGLRFGAYTLRGALGHPCKRRHLTGWGGKWWATVSLRWRHVHGETLPARPRLPFLPCARATFLFPSVALPCVRAWPCFDLCFVFSTIPVYLEQERGSVWLRPRSSPVPAALARRHRVSIRWLWA